MIPINRTYAPLQALVDELARCGMRHAVTSPGSRNAPLALTLAAHEQIDSLSVIDERSAGFVALGMAKATGLPVAVTCTSGTALANLAPAVFEAWEARVPLIVLSADRPPELREVGAGQSIDQLKLFGSAAKWFVEVGNHEAGRGTAVHHRSLGCRAFWTAAGGRPGPVHLNFPLREPLAPVAEELSPEDWAGREGGRPWTEVRAEPAGAGDPAGLAQRLREARRGAIVCGPGAGDVAAPAARLAAALGWPILAEPTSGVRCGRHVRKQVVSHYDVLLRVEGFARAHRPELVLRLGDTPTSKPLREWLGGVPQIAIDPHAAWHDPARAAELVVAAAPGAACEAVAEALHGMRLDPGWLGSWRRADALVPPALAEAPDPFEPKALVAIEPALEEDAVVWVSSSMPIRDVEAYFPQGANPLRFLANRGANGIDGVVSSAAGAARAGGAQTVLLTGEVALLHDLGGLAAARRAGIRLTIVCLNNGGGGIFDFLPVAEHADRDAYEEHVATPTGIPLEEAAAIGGLEHRRAGTPEEVQAAVARGPGLIEVRTDRAENVRLRREVVERVERALAAL